MKRTVYAFGRTFLIVAIVVASLSATLPAGAQSASDAQRGGTLIWALDVDPPTLDPHRWGGTSSVTVVASLYSSLFKWTYGGQVVGNLVTNMTMINPSLYEMELRRGVMFHDGTELTAEDVRYSIERIKDPSTGAVFSLQVGVIDEVEIVDDYTFRLHLGEPIAADLLREYLSLPNTAIVSKAFMETDPDLNTQAVGTGPFRLVDRVYGAELVVERHENYFEDGKPYLDRVRFVVYRDDQLRGIALSTGDVHVNHYVSWRDADRFRVEPGIEVTVAYGPVMGITYNLSEPPFDNPLVRRAVAHAVDREDLVYAIFFGYAQPVTGGWLSSQHLEQHWAFNPSTQGRLEYDPEKARELLAQAGYPACFSANLLTSGDHRDHWVMAEIVQESLNRIGCNVTVEMREWGVRVAQGTDGAYQFAINNYGPRYSDPDLYASWFHSEAAPSHQRPAGYDLTDMDALLDQARSEANQADRVALYREFEQRFVEESPAVFFVARGQVAAYRAEVQGFDLMPGPGWQLPAVLLPEIWLKR